MSAALLLVLLAAPAVPLEAAETAPVVVEDAVALVNGRAVLLSDLRKDEASTIAYLRRTNPAALNAPATMREVREGALEELITRELLVQEGSREGLTVGERDIDDAVEEIKGRFKGDAETGATLDDAAAERAFGAKLKADGVDYAEFRAGLLDDIMARKVLERNVARKLAAPTDAAARELFDRIAAYLASKSTGAPAGLNAEDAAAVREASFQVKALSSDGVRLSRILVRISSPPTENEVKRARKTAAALKKRLDDGADFAALARAESEDPESAARGGDIGYIVRGISAPELEKTAFSLRVGQTSEPLLTEIGYNIVRATERREARTPEYERFKEDLKTYLGGLAKKRKLQDYLKELHAKAAIERRLPPAP